MAILGAVEDLKPLTTRRRIPHTLTPACPTISPCVPISCLTIRIVSLYTTCSRRCAASAALRHELTVAARSVAVIGLCPSG